MTSQIIIVAALAMLAGCAKALDAESDPVAVQPAGNAAVGRALFVQKGCVLCHAVNGVGGKAGPALDAADAYVKPDPLGFAARIWRGAPAMVEFQSLELGYVIDLTGPDIAHLAAFAASRAEQEKLDDAAIPEPMRGFVLDERFWEVEDWSEFMKNGQEGAGDPEPPAGPEPQPEAEPQP